MRQQTKVMMKDEFDDKRVVSGNWERNRGELRGKKQKKEERRRPKN